MQSDAKTQVSHQNTWAPRPPGLRLAADRPHRRRRPRCARSFAHPSFAPCSHANLFYLLPTLSLALDFSPPTISHCLSNSPPAPCQALLHSAPLYSRLSDLKAGTTSNGRLAGALIEPGSGRSLALGKSLPPSLTLLKLRQCVVTHL